MNSEDRFDSLIRYWSEVYKLPEDLVKAQVKAESAFNKRAVSKVGAMGLMQLMPATARELSVHYPFDPDDSIRGGTMYMRKCINWVEDELFRWKPLIVQISKEDTYRLALAAYNGGIGYVWASMRALRPSSPPLDWPRFCSVLPHVRVSGRQPRYEEIFSYVQSILPYYSGA